MDLTILAPIGAVLALLFAIYQAKRVMKEDEGTDLMKSLSQKIRTARTLTSNVSIRPSRWSLSFWSSSLSSWLSWDRSTCLCRSPL